MKTCAWKDCDNEFTPRFKTTEKFCSSECTWKDHREKQLCKPKQFNKPIPKRSKKGFKIDRKYTPLRREYLSLKENEFCKIKGKNCTIKANTIEHTKGRGDYYYDEWAEKNDIVLTNDKRFWLASCLKCNTDLENDNDLSQKHQFSKIHGGKKI